jgi:hypothetical protein
MNYAAVSMDSETAIRVARIVDGLLFLLFVVGFPAIAGGIGYAAFKGRPRSFWPRELCADVCCVRAG